MILTITIICFLTSLFFLIAKLTGHILVQVIMKLLGLFGTILPIIYWLKLLNWI
jgi:hypothetical protein